MNKLFRIFLLSTMIFLIFSSTALAEIDNSDVNYFLEKLATTSNQDARDLGVQYLEIYVDSDEPDIEGLKETLEDNTPSADIEKLEERGYTLDEALDSLDILGDMDRSDVQKLIQAIKEKDLDTLKNVIGEYTEETEEEEIESPDESGEQPQDIDSETNQELEQETNENILTEEIIEVKFDDTVEHWAREDIEFLASRNIIKGQGERKFNPENNITRAEFTTLIVRVLNLQDDGENSDLNFMDINKEDWFYQSVKICNQYNIINGIDDEYFGPNDLITREQMVTIIIRALNSISHNLEADTEIRIENFVDKDMVSNWAEDSVTKAFEIGIINGRQDNAFDPKGEATRAESASIIKRVYDLMAKDMN